MTTTHRSQHGRGSDSRSGTWLRRAWIAVVLVPVGFGVAFAAGEALYGLASEEPGTAPVWVEIAVTACVLAICLAPCVAAVSFGRRAAAHGDERGRWPTAIGFLAGVGLLVLTLVSEIGDLVRR